MSWIENILIIAGISLDIFAAMEIEGAMLADVKRKSLMIASTIVTVLQLIFFFGGYFVCYELEKHQIIQNAGNRIYRGNRCVCPSGNPPDRQGDQT